MSKIKQLIDNQVNYDNLITISMRNDNGYDITKIHKILLILCLSTGLPMKFITNLKWKDILILNSDDIFEIKDEFNFRNYLIPVDFTIKERLINLIDKLHDRFEMNDYIINTLRKNNSINLVELFKEITIPESSLKFNFNYLNLEKEFIKTYNFETYTQIIFGKKVFEVSGYDNKVSKSLKQHFGFKLNSELFNFLGVKSKDEIEFDLHKVNLIDGVPIIKLKDKNFNQGYNFQKFTSFLTFLDSTLPKQNVFISVKHLLMLSLQLGVRPSSLINLNWEDILCIDEEEKSVSIKKIVSIKKDKITLPSKIRESFLNFYMISDKTISKYPRVDNLTILYCDEILNYNSIPNLNKPIFVMNSGNRITQPSLSREIKKFLDEFGFRYTDRFNTTSTSIMFGRRILEIKGDHKQTIKKLKKHFNFKSEKELFLFLKIDYEIDKGEYKFREKCRKNIFEEIFYDSQKFKSFWD